MMKEQEDASDDLDILAGLSLRVIDSPEGKQTLLTAAQNTQAPAKGVAQFLMLLIENISEALSQSGLDFNPQAWMATDGVIAQITDDIIETLEEGGVELDRNTFAEELYYLVADMVKGAAQAEHGQTSPTAGAGDMLAQAPLLS